MNLKQVRCKHSRIEVSAIDDPASVEDTVTVRCAHCGLEKTGSDRKGKGLLGLVVTGLAKFGYKNVCVSHVKVGKRITYAE